MAFWMIDKKKEVNDHRSIAGENVIQHYSLKLDLALMCFKANICNSQKYLHPLNFFMFILPHECALI